MLPDSPLETEKTAFMSRFLFFVKINVFCNYRLYWFFIYLYE
jgi:hypothetical protein